MPIDKQMIPEFFKYARERYKIMLCRTAGKQPPWTVDPVLQTYRFCNIFREDDRTTIWFRKNIRDPLQDDPIRVAVATVAFRWFNRIETGEHIKEILLGEGWNEKAIRKAVKGLKPLITGAYIIMPRPGISMGKLDGICWCMARLGSTTKLQCDSLEQAHRQLMLSPGMGPFMAYEVITDLKHTSVLKNAKDIMTWANPGPGAKRGLAHIFNLTNRPGTKAVVQLQLMQELLQASQVEQLWPSKWPIWDMRTVEHTLCEFDKYMRGLNGQRLKRKY